MYIQNTLLKQSGINWNIHAQQNNRERLCCQLIYPSHMYMLLQLLITLRQSYYNEAMKYKLKVQNEIYILTISLAKGPWTTKATAQNIIDSSCIINFS